MSNGRAFVRFEDGTEVEVIHYHEISPDHIKFCTKDHTYIFRKYVITHSATGFKFTSTVFYREEVSIGNDGDVYVRMLVDNTVKELIIMDYVKTFEEDYDGEVGKTD